MKLDPEKLILQYMISAFQLVVVIFLALLLFSCGSKKKFSETKTIVKTDTVTVVQTQVDTVFVEKIIEKTQPVYTETIVESPCDSLGNLRPINTKIGSGKNQAWIYTKDGKLYISQKLDSTRSIAEKEYRSTWRKDSISLRKELLKEFETTKKTTRTVWPWWLWTALIAFGFWVLYNLYKTIKPL